MACDTDWSNPGSNAVNRLAQLTFSNQLRRIKVKNPRDHTLIDPPLFTDRPY